MQKRDSLINLKDVLNAEKNADRTTDVREECMMLYAQNAALRHRFRSDQYRAKRFIVKNASVRLRLRQKFNI